MQSDSKSFSWGSSSKENFEMPSYYIPYKSAERKNSIESAQNQINLNSQKNTVEKMFQIFLVIKVPLLTLKNHLHVLLLNLRPRVQLNRQDPTSSNRDFERLIEQKESLVQLTI